MKTQLDERNKEDKKIYELREILIEDLVDAFSDFLDYDDAEKLMATYSSDEVLANFESINIEKLYSITSKRLEHKNKFTNFETKCGILWD